MRGQKAWSSVSAAVLLLTAVVGCSSSGTSTETGTGTGGEAKPGDVAAKPAQPKEAAKLVVWVDSGKTQLRPEGSTADSLKEVHDYILKEVGVDLTGVLSPVDSNAATTKLNLMLSTKEQMDIWEGSWATYKDTVLPLNELLDQYGQDIKKAWPEEAWNLMKDKDGKIWGIPRSISTVAHPVWVRTDWLQKLNLQMPKTLDELEAVLKAFKERDPDGNGKDDTIPLMTETAQIRNALLGAFTAGGNSNWIDPKDNKLKPVELDPGYKDFLIKMADWYQKGYIFKDAFGTFDHLQVMKSGKIGVEANWYSRTTLQAPKVGAENPGMDFQMAVGITGPKGLLQTVVPGSANAVMINKNTKDPAAAMKFLNWQYQNIENHLTMRYGMKDKAWKWADDKKFAFDLLDKQQSYIGDFVLSNGLANERRYTSNDPLLKKHADYLNNNILKLENGKTPVDTGVFYDPKLLKEKVPTAGDLDRLRNEEMVKFIMGARPISQFDQFLQELNKAGLDKWIDFYTEQYNAQKKK
jgi:putative aldouronate transport system substrate-binding protein